MADLDLKVELKVVDKASRELKKFRDELAKTKKEIKAVSKTQLNVSTSGGGIGGGGSGGIGVGTAAIAGAAASKVISSITGAIGSSTRTLKRSFEEVGKSISDALSKDVLGALIDITKGLEKVEHHAYQTTQAIDALTDQMQFFMTGSLSQGYRDAGDAIEDVGDKAEKSEKKVSKFAKVVGLFKKGAGFLGGIIGGISLIGGAIVGAAASAIGATKQAIDFADAIGKAADVAGVGTETLQELRFAFDKFGVSAQMTDEGLRRFTRRLGEFRKSGGGPAKTALQELGLSARVMNGDLQGTEKPLDAVIDLLSQIEDQAQRSALAAQLFGDDAGPKLALALGQGLEVIDELRLRARDLGIVLSDDVIRQAEQAGDEFSTLAQIIKVQLTAAMLDLLPEVRAFIQTLIQNRGKITSFAREMASFAKDALKLGFAIAKGTIELAKFFGIIDRSLDEKVVRAANKYLDLKQRVENADRQGNRRAKQSLTRQMREAREEYKTLLDEKVRIAKVANAARLEAEKAAEDMDTKLENMFKPGERGQGGVAQLPETFGKSTEEADKLKEALEELNKEGENLRISLLTPTEKYTEELFKLNEMFQQGAIGAETFKRAQEALKEEVSGGLYAVTRTDQEKLAAELDRLDQLFEDGIINFDTYSRAYFDAMDAMEEKTEETADAMNEFFLQAARSMQQSMSDFFFDFMQGEFSNLADSFKRTIDRMVADMLASQFAQMMFGNYGKTGSIGGIVGQAGSFISGLIGRASGGPMVPGEAYQVHAGEVIVPQVPQYVYPSKPAFAEAMGGGQTIHFAPVINTMDSRGVEEFFEDNGRMIYETLAGVGKKLNKGGF